jgi:hypothetical protein
MSTSDFAACSNASLTHLPLPESSCPLPPILLNSFTAAFETSTFIAPPPSKTHRLCPTVQSN